MDLFATLNVGQAQDQQAIEQLMTLRDKRWLASLGLKNSCFASSLNDCIVQEEGVKQADPNVEMAASEEKLVGMAMKIPTENERPVHLTMRLIRESIALTKNLTRRTRSIKDEDKEVKAILSKKILRLDWLDIGRIDNLDAFTHVETLYLQYNLIETIENLENHQQLLFLALAGNRIRRVRNLKCLVNLKFLDLSMNYIDEIDVSEFPESLCVLRLAGNPYIHHTPDYANLFFELLPNLVQIDNFRRDTSSAQSTSSTISSACADIKSESLDNNMVMLSLPLSQSPIDHCSALQDNVELLHHDSFKQETPNIEPEQIIDMQYEKQHEDRMSKWKLKLATQTSQTRQQVIESDELFQRLASSKFHEKRTRALSRARLATNAALADASSHLNQVCPVRIKEVMKTRMLYLKVLVLLLDGSSVSRLASKS
ncbi:putative leucine-rich repeat domain superfamily [Plasmopara halstedii]